jgi:hypothetical protein
VLLSHQSSLYHLSLFFFPLHPLLSLYFSVHSLHVSERWISLRYPGLLSLSLTHTHTEFTPTPPRSTGVCVR